MRDYLERRLRRLSPIFVAPVEDMPPADPDDVLEFSRRFLQEGTPAFRIVYYAMTLALQAICLATRGKSVYSLPPDEADAFIQSLYSHRISSLSAIPTVLGILIYMSHYDRDDVQALLGFDVSARREEAAVREVQR